MGVKGVSVGVSVESRATGHVACRPVSLRGDPTHRIARLSRFWPGGNVMRNILVVVHTDHFHDVVLLPLSG